MERKLEYLEMLRFDQQAMVDLDINLNINQMAVFILFCHAVESGDSGYQDINTSNGIVRYYKFFTDYIVIMLPLLNTKTIKGVKKILDKLVQEGMISDHYDYYCFNDKGKAYFDRQNIFLTI